MIRFNVRDPLIRLKISQALKGNKNAAGNVSNRGRKFSEDFRRKISASLRGKTGPLARNWKGGKKVKQEKKRLKTKTRRLKLRFQALLRDNFTCQYCGRTKEEVKLEIDHRFPKSKGGSDELKNYLTACKDCNIGKRDIILTEFN